MQSSIVKKYSSYSFLFGVFLLAISLPYSKFTMTVAEIILFLSWLAEGNLKDKINRFLNNKTALIISSLYVLHLIGLLYTSDFTYGLGEIKKKIPLLLLPLLFSTAPPLSKQMFDRLIGLFTLAMLVATVIGLFALLGYTKKQILHPQDASIYISHIRFGLLISLSVFTLRYFIIQTDSLGIKIGLSLLSIWQVVFLIMMESAAGLVCTAVVFAILFIQYIFNTKSITLKIVLASVLALACFSLIKIYTSVASEFILTPTLANTELLSLTKSGNPYTHDTINKEVENGNYVWRNVCETELSEAWSKRSQLSYSGKDLRGNDLKFTLVRFLTSKNLNKDTEGVNSLSENEIKEIEKGVANVNYIGIFNPTARLQKIIWEIEIYKNGGDPSGHSVIQRLEFWKAATGIIQENLLLGVGTGDVKNAFVVQYEKTNSPLSKDWRLRSHNQFLAIGTAFGILGLVLFIFTLFYPLLKNKKYNDTLYLAFFVIAVLSMLSEDTLETQAGITFFAFFNSLLLFFRKDPQTEEQK